MSAERVLAFRLARSGLAERGARTLAEAAACPASDFARDAAVLALAARADGVTREAYDAAVDDGSLVVAHAIRGAIHAMAPDDFPLYGRALLEHDDPDVEEVSGAVRDALAAGPLDKDALHAALRERVRPALLPWCRGCESHHVAPMVWRTAVRAVGARLDARRRYLLDASSEAPLPDPAEAVRRFLRCYGPGRPAEFGEWAGAEGQQRKRLWDAVRDELAPVGDGWMLATDLPALESCPDPAGLRLLPPGDPFLQKPNRALLVADPGLRKRLFRPVASPGVVLLDGRVAGLWRRRAGEVSVEPLRRLPRAALAEETERVLAAL